MGHDGRDVGAGESFGLGRSADKRRATIGDEDDGKSARLAATARRLLECLKFMQWPSSNLL
jgi:hypothetical protein